MTSRYIELEINGDKYIATVTEYGSTITVSSVVVGSKSAVLKQGQDTTCLAKLMLEELVNESLGRGGWRQH